MDLTILLVGCALCATDVSAKRAPKRPPATIAIPGYVPPLPVPQYFKPQGKGYRLCLQPGECA